jgi:anion-transporting  ArsA/GET3 family ATPase
LHAVQVEEVKRLEVIVTEKKEMIDNNQVAIKAATERIEAMFGEESLAVIEYLRERNKNRYDIREIKAKLKENKKEQDIRIARVREAYA